MSRSRLPFLFALFLVAPACSSDKTPPPGNPADGSTSSDGSNSNDGALSGDGALMSDGSLGSDSGGTGQDGGGTPPECLDLGECCQELPAALQVNCFQTSLGNNAANCVQGLDLAHQGGYCLPDSGTGPVDAGPAGPRCTLLDSCCSEAGALEGVCRNVAGRHNEGNCDQIINLMQGQGLCLGDAGTSTTTMDAGTSSTTDAAINLDAGAGNG